jgi:predicted AAA+ superfamily ATPase
MFQRLLTPTLRTAAARMPVVTLIGPRQSGKTTLVRYAFPKYEYVSLEQPDLRTEAREDPRAFLARYSRNVILDEVQRVPDLLSYIQVAVDSDDRAGRYILTGSQNFLLMEKVSQTLAGRTSVLHLLPLSLSELLGRKHLAPDKLGARPPRAASSPDRGPWETLWTGFFPRIHDKHLPASSWLSDYHRTYIERDLRDVLRVMDLDAFEQFVRLAAGRTGQVLNIASLADDAGVSQPTAKQWLTALRIASLIFLLPPHHANFSKRLRRRPKLHFLDSGLVCYLLGIRDAETLERHPLRGAIFESFVVGEFVKSFVHTGREAPLYHWRDTGGHEIDILLDLGDRLLPIEVKSGTTLSAAAIDVLRWWTTLPGNENKSGVLVHGGREARERKGFSILPWFLT